MTKPVRVAIIGSTGYSGVELIRILLQHPHVEIASVISSSSAGSSFVESYPHLQNILELDLDAVDPAQIKEKADVVFAATPAGVSSELVPQLLDVGCRVIDISGDFRLEAEEYETWYKKKPVADEYLEQAVYGLTEIFTDEIREANFISNPGCYPTATLLGIIPALKAGWIDPGTIIVDGKSGASGAGRKVDLGLHYAELNENFRAYKVNEHQHTPEIERVLSRIAGEKVTTTFTTHLVPMTRGILCTTYASLTEPRSTAQFIEQYKQFYEGRPFVRIRPEGKWPATKEVWGSNYCDLGFSVDERTGRVTILSVIDNVVKGAAGQAVQNLNVMMGWDETTGLGFTPVYP